MRALITGGAGFLGSNLAHRLLDQGHEVVILDDLSRPGSRANLIALQGRQNAGKIDFDKVRLGEDDIEWSISQIHAEDPLDAIFHLAAQTAVTISLADPMEDFLANAMGTLQVLEAVRKIEPSRRPCVVFSSTNKVYGDLAGYEGGTVSESMPLNPITPYGCSKAMADCYVRDYARTFGLDTVVLRFSCIAGKRQSGTEDQGWISHFVRSALKHSAVTIYGDGGQIRDVLHVRDACEALLLAAEYARKPGVRGEAFNVGGGPENTLTLSGLAGRLRRDFDLSLVLRFADVRSGDQYRYVSDIGKASVVFGWKPTIGVNETIERLVQWHRQH